MAGLPVDGEDAALTDFISKSSLSTSELWDRMERKRSPISFDVEVTARCNNDCRHCYINLPASDPAREKELSLEQIERIADEAVDLGAVWCLISGGEPLLRDDFSDIYLSLKRKGLLVSVFTNATLVREEHVDLFSRYPPRDIEVTVYGVTEETYERVTRRRGSYQAFMSGLNLLFEHGVKVRLKAMALRSNVQELPRIARFCRERSKDYYRFDPFLHLRYDGDEDRNEVIRSERLSPQEIVSLERDDKARFQVLLKGCERLINPKYHPECRHIFHCGAGLGRFSLSYDGVIRPCTSLYHPECIQDLGPGSLADALETLVPKVRRMESRRGDFLERCHVCPLINLCNWCPAHAYLETGELDGYVSYFCEVAQARAEALGWENVY